LYHQDQHLWAQNFYRDISHFLVPYEEWWNEELLNTRENPVSAYPEDWIDYLDRSCNEDLWRFDAQNFWPLTSFADAPFYSWVSTIDQMNKEIPRVKNYPPIFGDDSWQWRWIKGKKRYELELFLAYTKENLPSSITSFCDIGGGKGHLSRTFALLSGLPGCTVDGDGELHRLGRELLSRLKHPFPPGKLSFMTHYLDHGAHCDHQEKPCSQYGEKTLLMGLHTCGSLAWQLVDDFLSHENAHALTSMACCYTKLLPRDLHRSEWAKKHALPLKDYSLTLASRGHALKNIDEYLFKWRVKSFRFALHLLLRDEFGIHEFMGVGEAHPRDYKQDFSHYAALKITELGLTSKLTTSTLQAFFDDPKRQKMIRHMFLANLLRFQLGRPIELLLNLDRQLYCFEQGRPAQLVALYDQVLSPRNLILWSDKETAKSSGLHSSR
jgi:hypothetical protein